MAYITPIRALRYNTSLVPDLAQVITPPYDVIDAEAQDKYYRRHPNNIIRLEYGKTFPQDTEDNNRYTRAAADFSSWQGKGILLGENKPALYMYKQTFSVNGESKTRTGLMAGVKIEPYEKGVVLPHEETLPKHKADRLALMQACGANFSPIFSLYSDPDKQVEKITALRLEDTPEIDFTSEDGQRHRLWVLDDPALITPIQNALAHMVIFIADGHHRYETALNYRNLLRERNNTTAKEPQPYDFVMMTLVNLYDPGLVVLPTHRLVRNLPEQLTGSLMGGIEQYFTAEPFTFDENHGNFQNFMEILAQKGRQSAAGEISAHSHAFGLYKGNREGYIITLKNGVNPREIMALDKSREWCGLDVSVLHTLIMEKYLGIGGEQRASESNLTYTRDEIEALKKVDRGEYQMVFFLNPTLVEEVTAVAAKREKMPQKSTFFYPKLPTGILLAKLS
ncbi:conserved putative phosphatase [Desulfocucumis palustris]|uniref:Conserved putative phosphatase n=1 Tax=Desulfocucumis palustris TaxID=1898651 RepID=A0A2L2XG64_9FIRM|nr:DUF1015 domain-containing protein [Desulfocucumis palustris]GBF33216.1 conserved putative phosphatase [Desulfocucumis palustris]